MRLTTLLDTVNNGGSGPWPPGATAPDTLDQLVAELIPCRSNDPELWFAERTAEVERAKALCRTCPLVDGCLAGALEPVGEQPDGAEGAVAQRARGMVGGVAELVHRRGHPRPGLGTDPGGAGRHAGHGLGRDARQACDVLDGRTTASASRGAGHARMLAPHAAHSWRREHRAAHCTES